MQESVAATSGRACKWALQLYRDLGLKARVISCLYDSLVTLCPLEERFIVSRIHQVVMSDINEWVYDDAYGRRTLRYEIDNELNLRWSTKPTAEQKKQLADESYHPTPDGLKWILKLKTEHWNDMLGELK